MINSFLSSFVDAKSMSGPQPIGVPFYYTKNDDGVFKWTLATGKTYWSQECLNYLNYLSFTKFEGKMIQCVITGEKIVETKNGNFSVDGFINYKGIDIFIEFMGCFFHSCIFNCGTVSREDTRERDQKKFEGLQEKGKVLRIFGCEWEKLKSDIMCSYSPYSSFFYESSISQTNILQAIAKNNFYGFVQCDIQCSSEVKKYWAFFPPIFKRVLPKFDDLSPSMQNYFVNKKISPQLSVGFKAEKILLSTEAIKFYLEQKFEVTNIHFALEYQKGDHKNRFLVLSILEVTQWQNLLKMLRNNDKPLQKIIKNLYRKSIN